jgi:hypothetical protein
MGDPRHLVIDFLVWFLWLALFAIAQWRFCRKYPGMRTVCRTIFLGTMVVAVSPAIWLLLVRPRGGEHMMELLNHCFGLGVFAQTFLRATLMLHWLARMGLHRGIPTPNPLTAIRHERMLLSSLPLLTQPLRWRKRR